jgi:hypothetical protein
MAINRCTTRIGSAALIALVSLPLGINGHGYLKSPRSRNYVAFEDGKWFPLVEADPMKEAEPQSANIGGTKGRCGVIADVRNYDSPKNALGNPLTPRVQACYQPGQIIDVSVVLTAHHKGHFEFRACPIEPYGVATQGCFDAYPLKFISDTLYGANFDPNYPDRAYIPLSTAGYVGGTWSYSYKFQLPPGLSGDLVLLQWHYITANSCVHVGYDKYNWPVGPQWPSASDLIVPNCGPLPPDGNGVPEQVRAEFEVAQGVF